MGGWVGESMVGSKAGWRETSGQAVSLYTVEPLLKDTSLVWTYCILAVVIEYEEVQCGPYQQRSYAVVLKLIRIGYEHSSSLHISKLVVY